MKGLDMPINLIVIIAIAVIILLAVVAFFTKSYTYAPKENNTTLLQLRIGYPSNIFFDAEYRISIITYCKDRLVCYDYGASVDSLECFRDADLVEKYCNVTEATRP